MKKYEQEEYGPILKPMINAAARYWAFIGGLALALQGDFIEVVLLGGIYALAATDGPYNHKVKSEPEHTDERELEEYGSLDDEFTDDEVPKTRIWAS